MKSKAIIILGAQYGDEAKGNLTDYITNNNNIKYVVRFNGGANAGHTIVVDNKSIDTHLYPSGIATNNVINIIGNGVLMNIMSFLWETYNLVDKKFDLEYIKKNLIVSNRAHVTLLCQQYWDFSTNKIGTTNKGIGPTMACKALRVAMRMEDFMTDDYINKIKQMYNYVSQFIIWEPYCLYLPKLENNNILTNVRFENYNDMMEHELKTISNNIDFIRSIIKDTVTFINNIDNDSTILFEGANAFGLDTDFGTYPCVTSTSCITSACMSGSGISMKNLINRNVKVIGVFKAYITRVGSGSFPTHENNTQWGNMVQNIGKEYGVTTGRKRLCGHLDLVQLAHSTLINGYDELNITKLDVLCFADTIKVCIDYTLDENIINEYPSSENKMKDIKPIYKTFPGWGITPEELKNIKKFNDLPLTIQNFINYIENYIYIRVNHRINIKYINTSPSRNDKIIK
jgi:adenylosuccinate synthase